MYLLWFHNPPTQTSFWLFGVTSRVSVRKHDMIWIFPREEFSFDSKVVNFKLNVHVSIEYYITFHCSSLDCLWTWIGLNSVPIVCLWKYESASVTILADFSPEFKPPFRWRINTIQKNTVHINNLVLFEFTNRSSGSARSFPITLIRT